MYTMHISYLEIYNECGYDLLDPAKEVTRLEGSFAGAVLIIKSEFQVDICGQSLDFVNNNLVMRISKHDT